MITRPVHLIKRLLRLSNVSCQTPTTFASVTSQSDSIAAVLSRMSPAEAEFAAIACVLQQTSSTSFSIGREPLLLLLNIVRNSKQ